MGMTMVAGIIQARMGSSRLPGKVLLRAAGKTMFEHFVERVRRANTLDIVALATTDRDIDDPLVALAKSIELPVYRGSEGDVADRFYGAATMLEADVVVRLLNDCPLLDPAVIDEIVGYFLSHRDEIDFISNQYPHTYPDGMDVSAFSFEALKKLHSLSYEPSHREHIVTGFWGMGDTFRWQNYYNRINLFREHRWTLDYPEDFELISAVLEALYSPDRLFTMQDVLDFLKSRPDLMELNRHHIPRGLKISYTM